VRITVALLPLLVITPAFDQGFDAGVKLGIPVTQFFDTGATGSVHGSSTYLVGDQKICTPILQLPNAD
jgi:hypothetical protein